LSTTENTMVVDGPGVPPKSANGYGVATMVCVPTDIFAGVNAPFVSPANEYGAMFSVRTSLLC